MQIPTEAKDFSLTWLNAALADALEGNTITHCTVIDSDVPGQTAEIVKIQLEFGQPGSTVSTNLIGKYTSRNPMIIEEIVNNFGQYWRETSFYSEFKEAGIPVPHCYYQDFDPNQQAFVILMKDLSPAESPSWAISSDQVEVALAHLPRFHSKWWNDEMLRSKPWIVQPDNTEFWLAGVHGAAQGREVIESHFGNTAELSCELMGLAVNRFEDLMKHFISRPFTLVHGDYHAKQMFFPTEAGGEFSVIDWQFPFVAPGAWDFARMLGVCADTDFRRAEEQRLLSSYHLSLQDAGVEHYSRQDLENDYRIGLFVSQMIMCIAIASTDIEILKTECEGLGVDWKEVCIYRTQEALADWNVLEFVRDL